MAGEAASLSQPWRASHRGGHDDAKALFEAHRHIVSGGYRRTGDAELLAGGQDAQHISCTAGWLASPRNPIDTDMSPEPAQMAPMPLT